MIEPRTEIVLPGEPMEETLAFFRQSLGFRLESILTADNPHQATLEGFGLRILLDRNYQSDGGLLQIATDQDISSKETLAPNGTRIRYVRQTTNRPAKEKATKTVVTTSASSDQWNLGRVGMHYRDLIPGRMSGNLIASHIRIPEGGPVPDDVHFHDVQFQLIYCHQGWARLVYEDQGQPFVMRKGDCVLQPPQIRHRVLECSDLLEVVEIASPAEHLTMLDHKMQLPTETNDANRQFSGQVFHHYQHDSAVWSNDDKTGWPKIDLGIANATQDLADACVMRPTSTRHFSDDRQNFFFVLTGTCILTTKDLSNQPLQATDSATIPDSVTFTIGEPSEDLQLLRVRMQ